MTIRVLSTVRWIDVAVAQGALLVGFTNCFVLCTVCYACLVQAKTFGRFEGSMTIIARHNCCLQSLAWSLDTWFAWLKTTVFSSIFSKFTTDLASKFSSFQNPWSCHNVKVVICVQQCNHVFPEGWFVSRLTLHFSVDDHKLTIILPTEKVPKFIYVSLTAASWFYSCLLALLRRKIELSFFAGLSNHNILWMTNYVGKGNCYGAKSTQIVSWVVLWIGLDFYHALSSCETIRQLKRGVFNFLIVAGSSVEVSCQGITVAQSVVKHKVRIPGLHGTMDEVHDGGSRLPTPWRVLKRNESGNLDARKSSALYPEDESFSGCTCGTSPAQLILGTFLEVPLDSTAVCWSLFEVKKSL